LFGKISSLSDEVVNAEDVGSRFSCGTFFPLPVSIASHNYVYNNGEFITE